jgi:hypothetical protein
MDVTAADTTGMHVDKDLVGCGHRTVDLPEIETPVHEESRTHDGSRMRMTGREASRIISAVDCQFYTACRSGRLTRTARFSSDAARNRV